MVQLFKQTQHPESAKGAQLDNCDAIVYPRSSFVLHCKRIDLVSYLYIAICLSFPVGTHVIRRNQTPKFPDPVVRNNKFPGSFNHLCFIARKVNIGNLIVMLFLFVELQRSTRAFDQNPPGYYLSFNQCERE